MDPTHYRVSTSPFDPVFGQEAIASKTLMAAVMPHRQDCPYQPLSPHGRYALFDAQHFRRIELPPESAGSPR